MDKLTYHYDKDNKPNQLQRIQDDVTNPTNADDIKNQTTLNNYTYNDIGQLTNNADEVVDYEYNASGLVTLVKYNGKDKVRFYYNDKNFRTKKVSYKNDGSTVEKTTIYVRDVAGQVLAIYENGVQKEVPIYGVSRLGVYNKTDQSSVYQLTDHLGNVRAVIKKGVTGHAIAVVNSATDYYPFGMPMPKRRWGANGYRYAYQGQEIDPETGKEAFQLRLWDGRIGRWLTTDPKGEFSSPYLGMGNNPMNKIDPDGGSTSENPIYGSDSKFRGYDSKGVGGEAIIYDGEFTEGMDQEQILDNGGKLYSQLDKLTMLKFMTEGGFWHYQNEKIKYPDQYENYFIGSREYDFNTTSFGARGMPKGTRGASGGSALGGSFTQTIFERDGNLYLNVTTKLDFKMNIQSTVTGVNIYDSNLSRHHFLIKKPSFKIPTFSDPNSLGSVTIKLPRYKRINSASAYVTGFFNIIGNQITNSNITLNLYR